MGKFSHFSTTMPVKHGINGYFGTVAARCYFWDRHVVVFHVTTPALHGGDGKPGVVPRTGFGMFVGDWCVKIGTHDEWQMKC